MKKNCAFVFNFWTPYPKGPFGPFGAAQNHNKYMDIEVKKQIVEASKAYASDNGLGQEAIAELAGINISYVNAMWQGNLSVKGKGDKSTPIKDLYFKKVAGAVGVDCEHRYWDLVETPQFLEIYTELADSKNRGYMKMLIGETGCGKTYTVDRFARDYPANTYKVTVSNLYTIDDIINELCELVGVNIVRGRVAG
jgi:flagellar biosynthesis GTPase FlhF